MAQVNLKCENTTDGQEEALSPENLTSLLRLHLSFSNASWMSLMNAYLPGTCPFHTDY